MITPEVRILMPTDRDAILAFENALAEKHTPDPTERTFQSWSARWRPEALEHYLNLGWSYGVFDGAAPLGYVLAQPFLFVRGQMQTLWIEHLSASDETIAHQLLDTVYRWARDKHFQCLLREDVDGKLLETKTTKSPK